MILQEHKLVTQNQEEIYSFYQKNKSTVLIGNYTVNNKFTFYYSNNYYFSNNDISLSKFDILIDNSRYDGLFKAICFKHNKKNYFYHSPNYECFLHEINYI